MLSTEGRLFALHETEPGRSFVEVQTPPQARRLYESLWWRRIAHVAVLLVTDVAALLTAGLIGYAAWAWPMREQPLSLYLPLFALFLLFLLGYAGAGLYPGFGLGAVETLRRFTYCTTFAFLTLAAASFTFKLPPTYSRVTFVVTWAMSLLLTPLCRLAAFSWASRRPWWGEPAVLIGGGPWMRQTIHGLSQTFSLGYRPVGILAFQQLVSEPIVAGVPVLGGIELAPTLAKRGVRVALINETKEGKALVGELQQFFRRVVMIREEGHLPVERVRVCNLNGAFAIEFTNNLLLWRSRVIKRLLDLALGAGLLVLTSPLIVIGGILVKCASRGPLLFCQERRGFKGEPFKIWKLRTMYEDAEPRLEEYLSTNQELRREWEARYKLARDPRVIPGIGAFLRRWSIDELPQIMSVLKGEMSFVGPRPFPDYHLQKFSSEFLSLRQRVRPGVTGLWQVMVRSNGNIEEQQRYDAYYIRNWSLWLDLYILARTVWVVLVGRGAY